MLEKAVTLEEERGPNEKVLIYEDARVLVMPVSDSSA